MSTILSSGKRKIRKQRRCWGCTGRLAAGSVVYYSSSADCGSVSTAYWCEECAKADLDKLGFDLREGIGYGEIALAREESEQKRT